MNIYECNPQLSRILLKHPKKYKNGPRFIPPKYTKSPQKCLERKFCQVWGLFFYFSEYLGIIWSLFCVIWGDFFIFEVKKSGGNFEIFQGNFILFPRT